MLSSNGASSGISGMSPKNLTPLQQAEFNELQHKLRTLIEDRESLKQLLEENRLAYESAQIRLAQLKEQARPVISTCPKCFQEFKTQDSWRNHRMADCGKVTSLEKKTEAKSKLAATKRSASAPKIEIF